MAASPINTNVNTQKDNLPRIYSRLMQDLDSYKQRRETTTFIKEILYEFNLLNRELSSTRLSLVNKLIKDLSRSDIHYVRNYSSTKIEAIGSAEVYSVYSKIWGILSIASDDNEQLTRTFSAGSGELSGIIERYRDKLEKPMEVLNSYLLSQRGSQLIRSQARSLFDDAISALGLRN